MRGGGADEEASLEPENLKAFQLSTQLRLRGKGQFVFFAYTPVN